MVQNLMSKLGTLPTEAPPRLLGPDGQPMSEGGLLDLSPAYFYASLWNTSSKVYSYRYDEALRRAPEDALAMLRDLSVTNPLQERYREVMQLPYHIDPEDKDDAEQEAAVGIMTKVVGRTPALSILFYELEQMVWYGRAASQWACGEDDIGGYKRTVCTAHSPVNGDKIQFRWDGTPAVYVNSAVQSGKYENATIGDATELGIREDRPQMLVADRAPLMLLDKHWRRQFIIAKFLPEDADYFDAEQAGGIHGVGLRSRIYWAWWMKSELLGWAMNYMKKVGTLGLLVFPYLDGNKASKLEAQANAKNVSNQTALTVPVPPNVDPKQLSPFIISPSTQGIDALTRMLDEYFDWRIERAIIGQTASSRSDTSGMGTHDTDAQQATKYRIIRGDAEILAEVLTKDFLAPLQAWNLPGSEKRFRLKFAFTFPDPTAKDRMDAAEKLVSIGVSVKADDVRDAAGFGKPGPDDEAVGGQPQGQEAPLLPDGTPNLMEPVNGQAKPHDLLANPPPAVLDRMRPKPATNGMEGYAFEPGGPDQPRDNAGRWTEMGSGASGQKAHAAAKVILGRKHGTRGSITPEHWADLKEHGHNLRREALVKLARKLYWPSVNGMTKEQLVEKLRATAAHHTEKQHATEAGRGPKDDQPQHPGDGGGGAPAEAGGGGSAADSAGQPRDGGRDRVQHPADEETAKAPVTLPQDTPWTRAAGLRLLGFTKPANGSGYIRKDMMGRWQRFTDEQANASAERMIAEQRKRYRGESTLPDDFARRQVIEAYMTDESGHEHKGNGPGGGQFTGSGGGTATVERSKAKPATKSAESVSIRPAKTRAFSGNPVTIRNPLSKQAAGVLGERIVIAWLKSHGLKDARTANTERNNFPVDLVQDHELIEVKTGQAGNEPKAQQWRLTIGEPGNKEKDWLKTASPAKKAAWNARKQRMIHERKAKVLKDAEKALGRKVKTAMVTLVINPDTKTADLYRFDGFDHDRIGWTSDKAKSAYVGSFNYG